MIPVSPQGEFAPTSTELAIKCLKFVSHTKKKEKKKDNSVRRMKQNLTEHVYFLFFNPLKVTGGLEIARMSSWGRTHHGAEPVTYFKMALRLSDQSCKLIKFL